MAEGGFERKLGLAPLLVIGVAYMTPMAVFDTFGIITDVTQGRVAGAYVITTLSVLLTAWSYIQMVKAYPAAGSAYTFAQKTVGPKIGFLVGWAALADYMLLPMINVLLARVYLGPIFPDVPDWMWAAAFASLITGMNIFGMKMSVRVTAFMVAAQIAICLAVIAFAISAAPAESYSLKPLTPLDSATALAGAAVLVYSFLGFDAVTTLSEDAHEPRITIPKAVLGTALIGGALFAGVSYFVQLRFPDASMFTQIEGASAQIASELGGPVFQFAFALVAAVGCLASGMASQISASRLLYVMGRDRILPGRFFGYLSQQSNAPTFNIVLIGIVSLVAIVTPLDVAVSFISFGALTAFSFVNLAVIIHYLGLERRRGAGAFIRFGVLPALGLATVGILWFNLAAASLIGGALWLSLGVAYAALLWMSKGVDPFALLARTAEIER